MLLDIHILCAVKASRPSGNNRHPLLSGMALFGAATHPQVPFRNATNRDSLQWKLPFFIPFENMEIIFKNFIITIILTCKTHNIVFEINKE